VRKLWYQKALLNRLFKLLRQPNVEPRHTRVVKYRKTQKIGSEIEEKWGLKYVESKLEIMIKERIIGTNRLPKTLCKAQELFDFKRGQFKCLW